MNTIEVIKSRRSVRRYTGQVVSDEDIRTLLEVGFVAPSAHNYQPWHFIVVKDLEALEQVTTYHPYTRMLPKAGCGIIVCGDHEKQKMDGFIVEDASAAIQNILIGAESMGLSTVWCGIHPVEELEKGFRDQFNIPSDVIPVGLVVVGYSDQKKKANERYIETKVHFEKW